MRELKASTKAGQNIIAKGSNYDGFGCTTFMIRGQQIKKELIIGAMPNFYRQKTARHFLYVRIIVSGSPVHGLALKPVKIY